MRVSDEANGDSLKSTINVVAEVIVISLDEETVVHRVVCLRKVLLVLCIGDTGVEVLQVQTDGNSLETTIDVIGEIIVVSFHQKTVMHGVVGLGMILLIDGVSLG